MEQSLTPGFNPLGEENLSKHLNLVKAMAREIHRRLPRSVEYDDLYQNGVLGLMEAVKKFDSSKRVPFTLYAKFRIRGAILDGLRSSDRLTRSHRRTVKSEEMDGNTGPVTISASAPRVADGDESTSIEANLRSNEADSPYRMFQAQEVRELLDEAMEDLPDRHRRMMHLLFHEGLRASEVAERFQVNESRISQMRGSAIRRISAKFDKSGLQRSHFFEAAC